MALLFSRFFCSQFELTVTNMMNSRQALAAVLVAAILTVVIPETAYAYGGPGSVISAVGTLLAVLAAILASIFGFLWFPLKRLYKKITGREAETATNAQTEGE